ncbi:forkhead box protein N1 isoform X2 [Rhinatrema bivittatum]|uniref:forkhead box protein N1 isoform X2 n=1 Tax=Rhinatrema bivittatum TaxID=194408 RepID=UPI00112A2086|nr:forkhead box protein N1 isoform X2 [Rhinatrema bivittatum]
MASELRGGQPGTSVVSSLPGFLTSRETVTVSVLQEPLDTKIPSDFMGREWEEEEGTETSVSTQADDISSHCQSNGSDSGTERENLDSESPGPCSPHQDQIQGRTPANRVPPSDKNKTSASEKLRRYSYDEPTAGSYSRFAKSSRLPFHPYERHFPEAHHSFLLTGCSFKSMEAVESFEEMLGSTDPGESEPFTHVPELAAEPPWCRSLQYPSTNHDRSTQILCSQERGYPVTYITSSHYPYQRIAPQASLECQPPPYPKPIYSYSILIFMALKNSRNGSLPVSEIYNFMTEHFPYFKTAPDGWKNSVRHNLSLNKCFEKVENKPGSSSRKGCLWALNPSKIDKMQEELQKWKRKDPVAVRKSMAKPEELDRLIGDKAEKAKPPVMTCSGTGVPCSSAPVHLSFQTSLSSSIPGSLHAKYQPGCHPSLCYPSAAPPGYPQIQQHPGVPHNHFPPLETQGEPQSQYSPQDSPLPAHSPPLHSIKTAAEHSPGRTMQATLLESDLSNDIDALNPSLTDFELQGNLWEELKDDSLALDLIASSQTPPHCFPSYLSNGLNGASNHEPSSGMDPSQGGLADLHLTTLYSTFMDLDTAPTPYLSTAGSKPVALV